MYTGNDDEDEDEMSEPGEGAECVLEEIVVELHHAYVTQQNAEAKYREAAKGRGVDPSALRQTIEKRLAAAKACSFCSGWRRRGHWHKDAESPLNKSSGGGGDAKGPKANRLLALVGTACSTSRSPSSKATFLSW